MSASAKLRKIVRWVAIHGLWATGVLKFLRWRLQKENAILVLMMHRVLSPAQKQRSNSEAAMIVDAGTYRDMITHLQRHYRFVDLTQREAAFAGPRVGVGLSFDDGWQDNYEVVLRDLRERQVPATIFISPALNGQDNPFWPEQVRELLADRTEDELKVVVEEIKKLTPAERAARLGQIAADKGAPQSTGDSVDFTMDWEQIHALKRAGIAFASHTQNHEILTSLPTTEMMDQELRDSKRDLEAAFGEPCDVLAYPNGSHNDVVVERSAAMGYRRAFTVQPGAWTPETHPLRIPRLNISDGRVSFGKGFSAAAFEFAIVWRAYHALQRAKAARLRSHAAVAAPMAAAAMRDH